MRGARHQPMVRGNDFSLGMGNPAVFINTIEATRSGLRTAQDVAIIPPQSWATRETFWPGAT